jgi:hypothetical protein
MKKSGDSGTNSGCAFLLSRDSNGAVSRRLLIAATAAIMLTACSAPAPSSSKAAPKDETKESWYSETEQKLAAQNREAERLWKKGDEDAAAKLIQDGETLSTRLLAVRDPTLAAMQDASDLDDMYGRMLLANHNYGWARLLFQKNAARWRVWQPQTADTAARLKQAQAGIDECDRKIVQ